MPQKSNMFQPTILFYFGHGLLSKYFFEANLNICSTAGAQKQQLQLKLHRLTRS